MQLAKNFKPVKFIDLFIIRKRYHFICKTSEKYFRGYKYKELSILSRQEPKFQ